MARNRLCGQRFAEVAALGQFSHDIVYVGERAKQWRVDLLS